ncbi:hypothetical protein [Streptomyces rimosus]|uniref:hypothetical protein n=1 Tax=Streptomyces rimosus TaxID=1927 RepID=UPI000B207855|nr:hypothetical protein [Streptomyces rimosus]
MLDRIHVRSAGRGLAIAAAAVALSTLCSCGSGSADRTEPSAASPAASASATTATAPRPSEEPATRQGPKSPAARSAAKARPAPRPAETERAETARADSPGRHDGSNYDHLSAEGRRAHDTKNCAKGPGKKKGSCNELHRKCRVSGATAVSSQGEHLTCRTSPRDGRLRWLTAGE